MRAICKLPSPRNINKVFVEPKQTNLPQTPRQQYARPTLQNIIKGPDWIWARFAQCHHREDDEFSRESRRQATLSSQTITQTAVHITFVFCLHREKRPHSLGHIYISTLFGERHLTMNHIWTVPAIADSLFPTKCV